MESTKYFVLLYSFTGALNVILLKYTDILKAECKDGQSRPFQHPILQTFIMFLGELLCFGVFKFVYFLLQRREDGSENEHLVTRGGREFSPISLLLPALLDAIASILMFTALYLTYASSFQVIRETLIIFIAIFSSIYLNNVLHSRHWMGIFMISCGVIAIVSIDAQRVYYDKASLSSSDVNAILTGDLLIICAQVFRGAQFIYEEKFVKGADIPAMQAVGWQGVFGTVITLFLGICMNFMPTKAPFDQNSRSVFDDFGDVLTQLHSRPLLIALLMLFFISCACYNYTGMILLKQSTLSRLLAEGLSISFVWIIVLLLEWEYLNIVMLLGILIVQIGVVTYRRAVFLEWYRSLVLHIARRRYVDLTTEHGEANAPVNHSADVI
ncbi:solute carrier family 35 member F6 [Teleopsis dalmanni]|uniref:solute carrier family 35 member F6 n=1 Tax=Teleopsis dalmanni TaxID=139649 RepID=UPI0018CF6A38|nr:solute carrier family 35 member F6 [Teleopsis dalmanni]